VVNQAAEPQPVPRPVESPPISQNLEQPVVRDAEPAVTQSVEPSTVEPPTGPVSPAMERKAGDRVPGEPRPRAERAQRQPRERPARAAGPVAPEAEPEGELTPAGA
jgi:hypothetical protein